MPTSRPGLQLRGNLMRLVGLNQFCRWAFVIIMISQIARRGARHLRSSPAPE